MNASLQDIRTFCVHSELVVESDRKIFNDSVVSSVVIFQNTGRADCECVRMD